MSTQNQTDIMCFSEHWLRSNEIGLISFPSFKVASHFCRKIKQHVGSAIFVKDRYNWDMVPSIIALAVENFFEVSCCQHVVELNVLVACFYRVPNIIVTEQSILNNLIAYYQ